MYNSPLQKPSSAESLKQYEGLDVVGLDVVVGFVVVCLDVGFVVVGLDVVGLDVVGFVVVGFVVVCLDVVGLDVVGVDFVGFVVVGFGVDVVGFVVVGFGVVGFVVVCLDVVGLDVVGFVVGFLGGSVGDNCSCSWRRFLLLLWPRIVSCSLNEDMRAKSEAPYSWSTDAWWEELGDSLDPWSTDAGINDVV